MKQDMTIAKRTKSGKAKLVSRPKVKPLSLPRERDGFGKLMFSQVNGGTPGTHHGTYSIRPAPYAKGKVQVHTEGYNGMKSRACNLAESVGGKYSHRGRGYIMSPKQAETFHHRYHHGYDYSSISKKLTEPHAER